MSPEDYASVITLLHVALERRLRRQQVGTRPQAAVAADQSPGDDDPRALAVIRDEVVELQVRDPNAVRHLAGGEIRAAHVSRSVVPVRIPGKSVTEGARGRVHLVSKAPKEVHSVGGIPVHAGRRIGVTVRGVIAAAECLERSADFYWNQRVLLDPFRAAEEEQFVLQERSAKIAAELVALKRIGSAARSVGKARPLVAKVVEGHSVEVVGP